MTKLAGNLDVARHEVWAAWPGVEVGWIGNAAHQAEQSDHNPDGCDTVHAIDVMVTGPKAETVVKAAVGRPDLEYVIHNRVIWDRTRGWKPHAYTGADPHTNHVHISGKHGTACYSKATGTGYDHAAEAVTNAWGIAPKPAPKPPVTGHAPGSRVLAQTSPAETGDDVAFVQRFIGPAHAGAPDGVFGHLTAAGVAWYQHMRGIRVTSTVDAATWTEMGVKFTGG